VNRSCQRAAGARTWAAALAIALLAGAPPLCLTPAEPHAIVLESVPARDAVLERAPDRAILRFNGKIEKKLSRVTLTAGRGTPEPLPIATDGPEGDPRPDRLVVPLPALPPGPYVLRYKVLSADGHITEGLVRFTVKPVTGRP
jgi:methionine-rich copper-binding protein CopC